VIAVVRDISERKAGEAQIAFLASHDALTQLPNRVLLYERLNDALGSGKGGSRVAVLGIDLDNFKTVNDTLGHSAGDALLTVVAQRLARCVRKSDTIARIGGDEFVVLLCGLERRADVAAIAEGIVEAISRPYDIDGRQAHIGASVGIAVAPDDGTVAETLLKNADIALYSAKAEGVRFTGISRATWTRFYRRDARRKSSFARASKTTPLPYTISQS